MGLEGDPKTLKVLEMGKVASFGFTSVSSHFVTIKIEAQSNQTGIPPNLLSNPP